MSTSLKPATDAYGSGSGGYTKRELAEGFASLDGLIDRAHTNLDGPSRIYDGWGHPISKNEAVVTRRDWKGKAETSME